MAVGNAKYCKHCGLLYNPDIDIGVWECRVHRLPMDIHTGRFQCCGVQTRSSWEQRDFPIATVETTEDDFLGCYRADHDLDVATMPWPPIELCRFYTTTAINATQLKRTDAYRNGTLVRLTDYASYVAYGLFRPTFGEMMRTLPTLDDFTKKVHIPLLEDTLTDPSYYIHRITAPLPTSADVPLARNLLDMLRVELIDAAQTTRRVEVNGRAITMAELLVVTESTLPDMRAFWRAMATVVAVLFRSMDNPIPVDVRHTIVHGWVAAIQAYTDEVPLFPVLRVNQVQDVGTLYRAKAIARDIATYVTSSV